MLNQKIILFLGLMFSFVPLNFVYAAAGPPMITDDPKTPGPNNWEINLELTTELSTATKAYETPLADFNYGVGERIQLKLEVPWRLQRQNGISQQSGFNSAIMGVKWRFLDDEENHFSISTYPQQTMNSPVPKGWKASFAGDPVGTLLPIELQWDAGGVSLNEEVGEFLAYKGQNQFVFGSAISGAVLEKWTLLGELHGVFSTDWHSRRILYNVGSVVELAKAYSFLFSAGHTIKSTGPAAFVGYIALQLHI